MQSNFRFKKVWNTINTKNCKCVSDAGLKSYIVSTIFIIYTLCESVERSIYGHSLCLHANTAQCERSMWRFSHYFYEDNRVHLLHTQYMYPCLKYLDIKFVKIIISSIESCVFIQQIVENTTYSIVNSWQKIFQYLFA